MRLPAESAASSTPPVAAEPRSAAKAGTATCTIPTAVPKAASTPNTVRIPAAPSGPSQPTSCGVAAPAARGGRRREGDRRAGAERRRGEHGDLRRADRDDRGDERRRRDHRDLEDDRHHRVGGLALLGVLDQRAPQRAHRRRDLREASRRRTARTAPAPRSGAPAFAAITSAARAGTCPAAAARSTRVCPRRSMSRPCATAPSALARLKAPTTRPASRERARRVAREQQDAEAEHADRHRPRGRQDDRRAGARQRQQRPVALRARPRVRQDAHAVPQTTMGSPSVTARQSSTHGRRISPARSGARRMDAGSELP